MAQQREAICEWPEAYTGPDRPPAPGSDGWESFVRATQARLHAATDTPTVAEARLGECPPGAVVALAELLDRVEALEEKMGVMGVRW